VSIRPEDSTLWKVAPELAARLNPGDLVAIELAPGERFVPSPEALDLLRRLGCPTVVRPLREAS